MLRYNTQLKPLPLPEYGRNIQSMVDYCLTIEDRDERTRCARSIIASMGNLFPELRTSDGCNPKLWDHIAIMSDFKLDIDFPCEIIRAENLHTQPEPVSYNRNNIRYRHYGKSLERMVQRAAEMEEGEERDILILYLANHMKKQMLAVNRDGVEDERIFKDLADMSHGAIRLSSDTVRLHEFKEAPQPVTGKKKKKK
ncbi:MAG: DUF4290 domain-containing protein [Muribaculaceae bacterium]|nr:DUF4290 domain-containing protein [Muribaculaceae bacterium]